MSDTLKSCPFCNGAAEYVDDTKVGVTTFCGMGRVECTECGRNDGFIYKSKDAAIEAWNTRAAPKVKPLEWVDTSQSYAGERFSAKTIFGVDYVCLWEDRAVTWSGFIWGEWSDHGDEGGLDRAKAAAQADYDHRILSALDMEG